MQTGCPTEMLITVKMRCLGAYLHAESWKHKSLHGIIFRTKFRYVKLFLMFEFTEFLRIINSADDPWQATVHWYVRTAFYAFSALIH
jgi:hypothetical protein